MIRLFSSFYHDTNDGRRVEIEQCLRNNLENPHIDSIHLFLDKVDKPPFKHEKIVLRKTTGRPTYNDFFLWAREYNLASADITIICNSDIYFDNSLHVLFNELVSNSCAAMSRWDITSTGNSLLVDHNDSQDTWVFRGQIMKINGDFHVGIPRCDNRILHELQKAGYEVINPSFSIRSYHLHAGTRDEYKNENLKHFICPPYAYMWPHNLWSLPRTLIHNLCYPDEKVTWRLDKRKFSQTLPVRGINKVLGIFRGLGQRTKD